MFLFLIDPYSTPQGLDYCLFSLLISDLLNNLVLATVWICSSINGLWFFGNNACKLFAFISYAFWLVDIMSLFWLSVDRYLFITDIKYSTYKLRTKARFVQNKFWWRFRNFTFMCDNNKYNYSPGSSVKSFCRGLCQ